MADPRRRRRGRPPGPTAKTIARVDAYAALGAMPADALAGADYTLRVLQQSLAEVIGDTSIKPRQRRAEIRALARSMVPLLPAARLLAAEATVRSAMASREQPRADPPTYEAAAGSPVRVGAPRAPSATPTTTTPVRMPAPEAFDEET